MWKGGTTLCCHVLCSRKETVKSLPTLPPTLSFSLFENYLDSTARSDKGLPLLQPDCAISSASPLLLSETALSLPVFRFFQQKHHVIRKVYLTYTLLLEAEVVAGFSTQRAFRVRWRQREHPGTNSIAPSARPPHYCSQLDSLVVRCLDPRQRVSAQPRPYAFLGPSRGSLFGAKAR